MDSCRPGAGSPHWGSPQWWLCLLASCGNGPTTAQKKAVHDILTTTTTTLTMHHCPQ